MSTGFLNRLSLGVGFLPRDTALAVSAGLSGAQPRWLCGDGVALAVAIVASGVGYRFLLNGLALAAWVSLPLLLVWVTGTGIVLEPPP
jgi:hypothetical protein